MTLRRVMGGLVSAAPVTTLLLILGGVALPARDAAEAWCCLRGEVFQTAPEACQEAGGAVFGDPDAARRSCPAEIPELWIERLWVDPVPAHAGSTLTATALIRNTGTAPAAEAVVELTFGEGEVREVSLTDVGVGARSASVAFTPPEPGIFSLRAQVRTEGEEQRPDNNEARLQVDVGEPMPPEVEPSPPQLVTTEGEALGPSPEGPLPDSFPRLPGEAQSWHQAFSIPFSGVRTLEPGEGLTLDFEAVHAGRVFLRVRALENPPPVLVVSVRETAQPSALWTGSIQPVEGTFSAQVDLPEPSGTGPTGWSVELRQDSSVATPVEILIGLHESGTQP